MEFWQLTPRALVALMDRARAQRQHEDLRTALLASLFYNAWRGKGRAKHVEDFMLTPVERKATPPDVQRLKTISLFRAFGYKGDFNATG